MAPDLNDRKEKTPMASRYWIKLYHEILDDPKMGRLTDRSSGG